MTRACNSGRPETPCAHVHGVRGAKPKDLELLEIISWRRLQKPGIIPQVTELFGA